MFASLLAEDIYGKTQWKDWSSSQFCWGNEDVWKRKLKTNGTLRISVPDFGQITSLYIKGYNDYKLEDFFEKKKGMSIFCLERKF